MFNLIKDYLQYRKDKKIQGSDDPYFNLEIKEITEDGINVVMDWNPAMIKKLRTAGYPGINDEQVIEGYLHKIFEQAYFKNIKDEGLMKYDEGHQ